MKLFSIGDSITQGFMSFAAARTDACYSTLIANMLGADPYRIPAEWPHGGFPLNLETILRSLENKFGSDIFGPIEWLQAVNTIRKAMDRVERYYERGKGKVGAPHPGGDAYFHNIAVFGLRVADAWGIHAGLCKQLIKKTRGHGDEWFSWPNAPFYRAINTVLNPAQLSDYDALSPLGWLDAHVQGLAGGSEEPGVENLILWLGSNNVLGAVLRLQPNQTTLVDGKWPHQLSHVERERQGWNFWHPDHFAAEYAELAKRVDAAMRNNPAEVDWKVFVANVPHVTIAPLAKGFGPTTVYEDTLEGRTKRSVYYKYYAYFFLREKDIHSGLWPFLTQHRARNIDLAINAYNESIRKTINRLNSEHKSRGGRQRYYLVDVSRALSEMAWKRNNGNPTYTLPPALAYMDPPVNTKFYHAARNGQLVQGGIFGLDGVHPTVIGQGLVAYEFLKIMQQAGVKDAGGRVVDPNGLDWAAIIEDDRLYNDPIGLMPEVYEHSDMMNLIRRLASVWG
ncbi:MAG: hypothetical protein AMJ54_00075 [Deltaproteobacteria bacterium SG8_13]|nr:MAG: hypothetical protein AMJ54_00075 [Deltaproteobacteria bacterium SG8_13]